MNQLPDLLRKHEIPVRRSSQRRIREPVDTLQVSAKMLGRCAWGESSAIYFAFSVLDSLRSMHFLTLRTDKWKAVCGMLSTPNLVSFPSTRQLCFQLIKTVNKLLNDYSRRNDDSPMITVRFS